MTLRGWRLFGVAGTIFLYVSGILLLSIVSLNSPNQQMRGKHYGNFDVFKQRDLHILRHRPQLQWCQELHFLSDGNKNSNSSEAIKSYQRNPENFLKSIRTNDELQKIENENINRSKISNKSDRSWHYTKIQRRKNLNRITTRPPVKDMTALASFPGSGNTWLRYLLQQATGIYTGSVYKDYGLLKSGFPAEYISNASVLVVKTHEWGSNAWNQFARAILLVRDPDKSILAEFNRQSGGHVGFASPERYKRTRGRYWQQFVMNKLWAWEQMNLQWAKNFSGDVHIVYYDDLVNDTNATLRSILQFINFPVDQELYKCALKRKEGIYRRKKRIMPFDPFTEKMHETLETKKREVYSALGRYKF